MTFRFTYSFSQEISMASLILQMVKISWNVFARGGGAGKYNGGISEAFRLAHGCAGNGSCASRGDEFSDIAFSKGVIGCTALFLFYVPCTMSIQIHQHK